MTAPHTIILVDHGSRRPEANAQIEELANRVREKRPTWIVHTAHLEVVPPSVPEVIDRCVAQGARRIAVHPFFLLPGKHTREDLPAIAAAARERHRGVQIEITESPGLDERLVEIVLDRIDRSAGKI